MARALPERPAHPAVTISTVELGRGQPGGGVLVSCPPRSGASDRFTPPPRQVRGAHWPLSPPQKHEPIWTREAEAWTPPPHTHTHPGWHPGVKGNCFLPEFAPYPCR